MTMHRPPAGEWIASRASSFWEPTGIGLARALLYDRKGLVGTATQTLLIRRT